MTNKFSAQEFYVKMIEHKLKELTSDGKWKEAAQVMADLSSGKDPLG